MLHKWSQVQSEWVSILITDNSLTLTAFDNLCKGMSTIITINFNCFVGRCSCAHYIASQLVQLNPCRVCCLLFMGQTLDIDWEFLLHGALFGFNVINKDCPSSHISNFRKVLDTSQSSFISNKLRSELQKDHIAHAEVTPICLHNIFTVPKSLGEGYQCVVNCSKPQELSVNNFVDQVCQTFSYKGIDDLVKEIITDDFIAVVDIKALTRPLLYTQLIDQDKVYFGILDGALNFSWTIGCI